MWDFIKPLVRRRSQAGLATRNRVLLRCNALEDRLTLDDNSAGEKGIDARMIGATPLTGAGVHIGQVETQRPGKRGFDTNANSHPDVTPNTVNLRAGPAVANTDISKHAVQVAGVIIANGMANRGIAPGAILHSSTYRTTAAMGNDYEDKLLSMQYVARLNGGDVPVVNNSWGVGYRPGGMLDGNSLLTLGVDFLTVSNDALYVISKRNRDGGLGQLPTDSFNGVIVGGLSRSGLGTFNNVYKGTDFIKGVGDRRLIQVLAPADIKNLPSNTPDGAGTYTPDDGNSFAAPHVTGTIALMQEYARSNVVRLTGDAQHHLVMKAALLNSAEKVKDRLGADRTIFKTDNSTWDTSDARDVESNQVGRTIPLDAEMGVGAIDARRAVEQLNGGNFAPQNPNTGVVGFDYEVVSGGTVNAPSYKKYTLPTLKGGGWMSATLTWDRQVSLDKDAGVAGLYDVNDTFKPSTLANLDLLLMKANETDPTKSVWSSESTAYNLEHIFYQLPAGDNEYELWVRNTSADASAYGLAWWTEAGTPAPANPKKVEGDVWDDDGDGLKESGESGHQEVQVDLVDPGTGQIVATRYTDSAGRYSFAVSQTAQYRVVVTPPTGYSLTTTGTVDIYPGTADVVFNAGIRLTPGSASIGDQVWLDADADGERDLTESGLAGISVTLRDAAGNTVETTATDSDGKYQFTGVSPGNYTVVFAAPSGARYSAGAPTWYVTAFAGDAIDTADAGVYFPATVSGRAWRDTAADGIRQPGEPVVSAGITVDLLDDSGELVASMTTDSNGEYRFDGLNPGDYQVVFTPRLGYTFAPRDQGGNDAVDSDADPTTGATSIFSVLSGGVLANLDVGVVGNNAPVAQDDWVSTPGDTSVVIAIMANDSDPDGDPLTATVPVATLRGGALAYNPVTGLVTYTPPQALANSAWVQNSSGVWTASDQFTYTVSDGFGGTASATVRIEITAVLGQSVYQLGTSGSFTAQRTGTLRLMMNDDVLSDNTSPAALTVTINGQTYQVDNRRGGVPGPQVVKGQTYYYSASGNWTYNEGGGQYVTADGRLPANGPPGPAGGNYIAPGLWQYSLIGVIDPPTPAPNGYVIGEGGGLAFNPVANATTSNGPVTVVGTPTAQHGTITVNPGGGFVYTPDPYWNGVDTISYMMTDSGGAKAVGTATVTVLGDAASWHSTGMPPARMLKAAGTMVFVGVYDAHPSFPSFTPGLYRFIPSVGWELLSTRPTNSVVDVDINAAGDVVVSYAASDLYGAGTYRRKAGSTAWDTFQAAASWVGIANDATVWAYFGADRTLRQYRPNGTENTAVRRTFAVGQSVVDLDVNGKGDVVISAVGVGVERRLTSNVGVEWTNLNTGYASKVGIAGDGMIVADFPGVGLYFAPRSATGPGAWTAMGTDPAYPVRDLEVAADGTVAVTFQRSAAGSTAWDGTWMWRPWASWQPNGFQRIYPYLTLDVAVDDSSVVYGTFSDQFYVYYYE